MVPDRGLASNLENRHLLRCTCKPEIAALPAAPPIDGIIVITNKWRPLGVKKPHAATPSLFAN